MGYHPSLRVRSYGWQATTPNILNFKLINIQHKAKNPVTARLIVIVVLTLVFLIPMLFVQGLVLEREYTRDTAIQEASGKWANLQTIGGPILTIPYKKITTDKDGNIKEKNGFAYFLPDELNVTSSVSPQTLQRGIYEIIVYSTNVSASGVFPKISVDELGISETELLYSEAFVSIGIPDMRGIEENITLKWNDADIELNPGLVSKNVIDSGVSARVSADGAKESYTFSFDLALKGSNQLNFLPLGKTTSIDLTSNWQNPSFDGAFLPDEREISNTGFTAKWKILDLNRNFPQSWLDNMHQIHTSTFGVTLLAGVDEYQKTTRSVKYALLFIALTFLIFFFAEIFNSIRIHPIQYLLVGFALTLFYTLLLSISEHLGFNTSYAIASIATIVLITIYSKSILKSTFLAMLEGLMLIIMYVFMFILLRSQDYALLLGSIGLFTILAIVMYISNKIDWYSFGSKNDE
jgi:inner membrane protein